MDIIPEGATNGSLEALRAELSRLLVGRRAVVMGVGNTLRSDDGFGPALAARLSGRIGCAVLDAGSAPENFTGRIRRERAAVLLVVDAADFGGKVGELRLLSPRDVAGTGFSTHAESLGMLFDYLGSVAGIQSAVLAVQAGSVEFREGLSGAVAGALEIACRLLVDVLPPVEGTTHA